MRSAGLAAILDGTTPDRGKKQGRLLADHSHVLAEHSQAHGKTLAGIEQILTRPNTLGEDR
jgi:hypothetical protein